MYYWCIRLMSFWLRHGHVLWQSWQILYLWHDFTEAHYTASSIRWYRDDHQRRASPWPKHPFLSFPTFQKNRTIRSLSAATFPFPITSTPKRSLQLLRPACATSFRSRQSMHAIVNGYSKILKIRVRMCAQVTFSSADHLYGLIKMQRCAQISIDKSPHLVRGRRFVIKPCIDRNGLFPNFMRPEQKDQLRAAWVSKLGVMKQMINDSIFRDKTSPWRRKVPAAIRHVLREISQDPASQAPGFLSMRIYLLHWPITSYHGVYWASETKPVSKHQLSPVLYHC